MSKVRLREGYGPRDVPLLDRLVEDGETVEVPDFQADGVSPLIWPEETWEPVAEPVVEPEPDAVPDASDTSDSAEPAAEPEDTTEQAAE